MDVENYANCVREAGHHRRLRLRWTEVSPLLQHRDARRTHDLVSDLARRIGPVPEGGQLPRALQQQRWSPINVPLFWAASGTEESTPVLEWLIEAASEINQPVGFRESIVDPPEAVRGVECFEADFPHMEHQRSRRFDNVVASAGLSCQATGQSHLSACSRDLFSIQRVESTHEWHCWRFLCVRITLHRGRMGALLESCGLEPQAVLQSGHIADRGCAQLDSIDVKEFMSKRVPLLKSCPHFLRRRFR